MNSDYYELEDISRLQLSFNPLECWTGRRLAKRFEKLLKHQGGELTQLAALRKQLDELPPGEARQAVAQGITRQVLANSGRALRIVNKILREAGLPPETGKQARDKH